MDMRAFANFGAEQSNRGKSPKKFTPWELEQLTYEPGEAFYLRFLPPMNDRPYMKHYHWPAGGRPYVCTASLPEFDGQCRLCQAFPDKNDRGKRRTQIVLECIDFRYFHVVPSDNGRSSISRCLHNNPELPSAVRCTYCRSTDASVAERHGPLHKVVEMNHSQWEQLWNTHLKLQGICTHVEADGSICNQPNYPVAYVCSNAECESILLDEDSVAMASMATLSAFEKTQKQCSCGNVDLPWGIYACEGGGRSRSPSEHAKWNALSDEERAAMVPGDAAHWVARGSVFGQTVQLNIVGEEKLFGEKTAVIKKFNFSTSTDWSNIHDDLKGCGLSDDEIAKLVEPWDMENRYRPMRQLKRSEYPNTQMWVEAVLATQADAAGIGAAPQAPFSGMKSAAFRTYK